MIDRRLFPEKFSKEANVVSAVAGAELDRVVEFYDKHSSLRPWVRYFHPVTGSIKRSLGRDCEDGMRLMERQQ